MRHRMWVGEIRIKDGRRTDTLNEDASATLDLKAIFCCLVANEVCKKAAILANYSAAATN